jgi:hypothetical protein
VEAVQSEETKNWYAGSNAVELEIPMLQLASFAADQNEKQVLEKKNHHGTSCCFMGLQCAASSSCAPQFLFSFQGLEPYPPCLEFF